MSAGASTARAERLVALLDERGLDALLVSDLVNVRYLTGYTGSNGLALVGPERRVFLTDFRYVEQAAAQVPDFDRPPGGTDLLETAAGLLRGRVGFDDAQLSVRSHERLRELAGDGVELVAAGGLVERLRAVKDAGEVERIAAAAALADEILAWVVERGIGGRTERELAVSLEHEMRVRGARGPSFPSIVAHGAHGALPHASPRDVEVARGTLVTFDIGCLLDGYCSDITRTFACGEVDEQARAVYELVLKAQLAGLAAVRPGPSGVEVDEASRAVIEDAGYGERFGHGLGHGVGLEVHEGPRLSRHAADEPLVAGNIVTVEPGVYLPGRLGVRIEDLVCVTAEGHDVLSAFPKELLSVD